MQKISDNWETRFADICPACGRERLGMVQKTCRFCGEWVCEICCFPNDGAFFAMHQECFDKYGVEDGE
jgi:hypothetical protein